jgi:hypothetical protein
LLLSSPLFVGDRKCLNRNEKKRKEKEKRMSEDSEESTTGKAHEVGHSADELTAETGRCLCGAVSFTAAQVDPGMHACHCSNCRRWTGGPSLSANAAGVVFEGTAYLTVYESSAWGERGFCRKCGSSLFFRLQGSDRYILNHGSFDNPDHLKVVGEIYIDEKPSSYDFQGEHKRLTGEEFLASLGITPE